MRPASHLCLRECTAVSEDHSVWSLREPSTADTLCFDDENDEQNCILREREKWRTYICTIAAGETASSGWWCAEASPKSRPAQAARRRWLSNAPTLFAHAGGLHDAISSRIGDRPLHAFAKSPMRHLIRASQYRSRPPCTRACSSAHTSRTPAHFCFPLPPNRRYLIVSHPRPGTMPHHPSRRI